MATPGVVAEHVDLPEGRLGAVGGLGHGVAVGDVERQGDGVGVAWPERGVRALQSVLLDVGQGDLHAGRREGSRHREAHATGGAGDERDLSCYVSHEDLQRRSADGITGPAPV